MRSVAPTGADGGAPASPDVSVSVVICAYTEERWDDVLAAVASALDQEVVPAEVLVVVDHNPTLYELLRTELSATSSRARSGARGAGGSRVRVMENQQAKGLSGGRNTGVAAAIGDVVAFLDDDAEAETGWLAHLAAAYADERVLGVGGATFPDWLGWGRPAWFPPEFDWVLGCSYRGLPTEATPVRNPFGGNCSFRRSVFGPLGGFTTGIGRGQAGGGTRPLGCEETEFSIRLHQRYPGAVLLYEPGAVIWHKVPVHRARGRYFCSRCYAEGLSKAAITRVVGAGDGLASERAYTLRVLPTGVLRGLWAALRGDRAGLARSGAIVGGLAATGAGYAVGRLRPFAVAGGLPAERSFGPVEAMCERASRERGPCQRDEQYRQADAAAPEGLSL